VGPTQTVITAPACRKMGPDQAVTPAKHTNQVEPDQADQVGPDQAVRAIQQLPRQQRLVMAWHLDGFDTKEISDQLNMPPATVRSHLRHARGRLKVAYQTRSAGPPDASGERRE
jgi:DNA-directed RNA polymerase specialized sigma24 family protein